MNTKNKNIQESFDLQMDDSANIKEMNEAQAAEKTNKNKKTVEDKKKSVTKKSTKAKASSEKKKTTTSKFKKTDLNEDTSKQEDTTEKTKKAIVEEPKENYDSVEETVDTLDKVDKSVDAVQETILEDIKRYKLFFVSDMDEEAVYLHEMSLQGYHFVTKKGMQYVFRQGEPKNYFYHLGYYEKDKRDGERYLDNYVEAGWENIFHEKAEFDGVWNYFRIEMPIGEPEPNIFSDRVSRLALYKRLLSSWRTLLAVDIICFFFTIFVYVFLTNHPMNMTSVYQTLCAVLILVIVLIFIIYLRAYLKISRKQNELENL